MLQHYLQRHSFREQLIEQAPNKDLSLVVVIPVHDEPELIPTLDSLAACLPTKGAVEVILVFNASEDSEANVLANNKARLEEVIIWKNRQLPFQLFCIEENQLPAKHAGVGLARKIGMDEAVRRFKQVENEAGVIVCFDADSRCEQNYLQAIEAHFEQLPTAAASIHFEHPLEGKDYSREVYEGILYYELHLRYYKNALSFASLPFAYHTIGSSMAVRVSDYCKQGGMNRRKAGEDFYFLQKYIDQGSLTALTTTMVIPSPRQSHRVPFGTGRAIQEMLSGKRDIQQSYAAEIFHVLKESFSEVHTWYNNQPDFHPLLKAFAGEAYLQRKLEEVRRQSTTEERFVKRFFQFFNAFQVLKWVHYLRDEHFGTQKLEEAVPQLFAYKEGTSARELLALLRAADRGN
jgi:hypothetical protein